MPPLNERLQVDRSPPDVELIRKLENERLGAYLCFVDVGVLIAAYWIAMQASVVIAVTIEIFATLIVTLGIFYIYRTTFTLTTLKCTEYVVILITILGLSSVFDLQNQVRLFNIERLKTEILQSKEVVRSLSIDKQACEYADMFVHSEQRHLEWDHVIDPHDREQISEKMALLRDCEIVRLARLGNFDTSVERIKEYLRNSTLSEFGFHDVVSRT